MSMVPNLKELAGLRAIAVPGALHVAPYETFCDDTICHHERGGIPLFAGAVHLGPQGNEIFRGLLEEAPGKGG